MEFIPHTRRKTCHRYNSASVSHFPKLHKRSQDKFHGIFTGFSVEVTNQADICSIYENGCYGKGSKSRGAPQIASSTALTDTESLVLGLEEAIFLAFVLKVLKIYDLNGAEMNLMQLIEAAEKINSYFCECLAAYVYLKSKGWVVKQGVKFGGDFMIYKKGPRFYHGSFIVIVHTPNESTPFIAKNIKGLQRIAETSDKDILLLEITKPLNFELDSVENLKNITATETIIRRFNYNAFVQGQKIKK